MARGPRALRLRFRGTRRLLVNCRQDEPYLRNQYHHKDTKNTKKHDGRGFGFLCVLRVFVVQKALQSPNMLLYFSGSARSLRSGPVIKCDVSPVATNSPLSV